MKSVLFSGLGGQGIVKLAVLLAYSGNSKKLFVSQSASYDAAARGAITQADVIISAEPIDFPVLENADIHVSFNEKAFEKYNDMLLPKGIVIYDSSIFKLKDKKGYYTIPATQLAVETLQKTSYANIMMFGALSYFIPEIEKKHFIESLKVNFPKGFEDNLRAFETGRKYFG